MQMQFPSMSRVNKIIVISFVAVFILASILKQADLLALENYIGLSPKGILSGKVWTFFTYALLPHSLMECLFDGLIFWFIGSELENMWGEPRYLSFLLITALGASFLYLGLGFVMFSQSPLFGFPYTGPAGIASTMCVAYGILFPKRTMYFFFFPMEARWFVTILVGVNLYNGFFSNGGILAWAQIAAMASGVLWMVFVSHPELKNVFKGSKGSSDDGKPFARSRKRSSKISHLHIVEDSEDDKDENNKPPTYH